jgi:hypothetical protein
MVCALRCRRGSGLAVDQRVGTGGPGLSVRSASGGDRRRMWQWLRHLLGAEKLAAIFTIETFRAYPVNRSNRLGGLPINGYASRPLR